ncbi:MAG: glycosyltransferase family 2 protein [Anaerolineae bacterium]
MVTISVDTTPNISLAGVSVIIPTFLGADYLEETLGALQRQNYAAPVEIIAVDSGSTDGTLDILRRFDVTIVPIAPECFSHGYARNLGVRWARNPIVVFMSQDAVPANPDLLQNLVAALELPNVAAVYARQLPRSTATPLETFFQLHVYPDQSKRYEVQREERLTLNRVFFSNVCSAARREICVAYPFNETLVMSEDQAFARELLLAGYATYYHADAKVVHSHRYSLPRLFRRNFDSAYSLQGVTEDTGIDLLRQAVTYIGAEVRHLLARHQWRWLLYLPLYEAVRIAGRLLGGHTQLLSRDWLRSLSLNRAYWARESHSRSSLS